MALSEGKRCFVAGTQCFSLVNKILDQDSVGLGDIVGNKENIKRTGSTLLPVL
jgi:hypothetical protein